MQYRRLGKAGFDVSVVALGTWAIGGKDFGHTDDRDSIKAIHRALDLGVTLFDTAPIYGSGRAEEIVGKALVGIRKDVIIATKCGPVEPRPGLLRMDYSPKGLAAQVDASLRRLQTDVIDLLQLHWPDPAWPIEDAVGAMARLVQTGKVRAIGVSNTQPEELQRALAAGPVVSVQEPYSLLNRDFDKELLPLCREHDLAVLVYEPLARGLLSGKFNPKSRFEPGDVRATDPRFKGKAFLANLQAAERVATIARTEGLPAAQAAIAWVLAQPGITTALCGAKTAAQTFENARAADLALDATTLAALDGILA
jgi:aryl-alcohol dehydrogenase-like predicted oxidoreductase